MAPIRVIAADSDPAFLCEAVSLLSVEFDVVATATDGQEALGLIRIHRPEVAVLDFHLPTLSGIVLTEALSKEPESPRPHIVLCSLESHSMVARAALHAGALGYVLKPHARRDLIRAVRLAFQGESFVSAQGRE